MTAKMITKPGATIHQLTAWTTDSTPLPSMSGCMPSAAPIASRKAPSAPSAGHGLGSTRWYGWLGPWCALSAMYSAPSSSSVGGRPAEQDFRPLRLRLVEGVRQRNGADVVVAPVLGHLCVDEEDDRHVDRLAGLQQLLGEAEALDLVEPAPGALGRDVERGSADDRPLREVGGAEEDQLLLAKMDLDLALHRLEAPRQVGVDVGIEAHLDGARADRTLALLGDQRRAAK